MTFATVNLRCIATVLLALSYALQPAFPNMCAARCLESMLSSEDHTTHADCASPSQEGESPRERPAPHNEQCCNHISVTSSRPRDAGTLSVVAFASPAGVLLPSLSGDPSATSYQPLLLVREHRPRSGEAAGVLSLRI